MYLKIEKIIQPRQIFARKMALPQIKYDMARELADHIITTGHIESIDLPGDHNGPERKFTMELVIIPAESWQVAKIKLFAMMPKMSPGQADLLRQTIIELESSKPF